MAARCLPLRSVDVAKPSPSLSASASAETGVSVFLGMACSFREAASVTSKET